MRRGEERERQLLKGKKKKKKEPEVQGDASFSSLKDLVACAIFHFGEVIYPQRIHGEYLLKQESANSLLVC